MITLVMMRLTVVMFDVRKKRVEPGDSDHVDDDVVNDDEVDGGDV